MLLDHSNRARDPKHHDHQLNANKIPLAGGEFTLNLSIFLAARQNEA